MGTGSSDPSSSSSSTEKKKKKKKKKEKKDKSKKAKHIKKDSGKDQKKNEKQRKRIEKAQEWQCDRSEVIRLVKQLLEFDASVENELQGLFDALDDGQTVHIEGLESKQIKKKLRHLFQALKLSADGQGFKTADSKVSFSFIFQGCLNQAKIGLGKASIAKVVEPIVVSEPVVATVVPSNANKPVANSNEFKNFGDTIEGQQPIVATGPPPKRRVGPQLPMPGIGPAGNDDASSVEEEDEGGPQIEGCERRGIDLDMIDDRRSRREEWMSTPRAEWAAAFMDGGSASVQKDKYMVGRSKEEIAAFEKLYKDRGPSLLQEQMEGKFIAQKAEQDKMRKRKYDEGKEVWGMSEKQASANGTAPKSSAGIARPAFDPEKDMKSVKPMTTAEFSKLVENSSGALAGRFDRGGMATSFL